MYSPSHHSTGSSAGENKGACSELPESLELEQPLPALPPPPYTHPFLRPHTTSQPLRTMVTAVILGKGQPETRLFTERKVMLSFKELGLGGAPSLPQPLPKDTISVVQRLQRMRLQRQPVGVSLCPREGPCESRGDFMPQERAARIHYPSASSR